MGFTDPIPICYRSPKPHNSRRSINLHHFFTDSTDLSQLFLSQGCVWVCQRASAPISVIYFSLVNGTILIGIIGFIGTRCIGMHVSRKPISDPHRYSYRSRPDGAETPQANFPFFLTFRSLFGTPQTVACIHATMPHILTTDPARPTLPQNSRNLRKSAFFGDSYVKGLTLARAVHIFRLYVRAQTNNAEPK